MSFLNSNIVMHLLKDFVEHNDATNPEWSCLHSAWSCNLSDWHCSGQHLVPVFLLHQFMMPSCLIAFLLCSYPT